MGGRGFDSGTNPHQLSMERVLLTNEVSAIRSEANMLRNAMEGSGIGGVPTVRMKQCFCCEEFSLPISTEYETCGICGWIDDPYQNKHPDSEDGKNPISLNEARKEFAKNR